MPARTATPKKPRPTPAGEGRSDLPSQTAGARSEAKQQTRAALVEAASRLFHERGLEASLDDICAAAGYTRGAFYVHFKDREDLIAAVVAETNKHRIESFIANGEGRLDLERTIRTFAEAVRTGAFPGIGAVRLHQFLAAIDRSAPVREEQQRLMTEAKAKLSLAVRDGQAAGSVRRDVKPEAIAELLLALVGGVEVRLAYGTFDVTSVTALLRMLRPAKP